MSQLPNGPVRILVLDDSPDTSEVVANLLRAEPGFAVTTSAMAFGEGARAARRGEPDVILLLADSLVGSDTLLAVEELDAAAPGGAIIVLTASDPARARELILAGARDCVAPPYTRESLTNSVRKVHQNETRRRERLSASMNKGLRPHRCLVIAFHGAKGGVGTTTVAVNTAIAIRENSGERVAIVDASLQAGDVGVALNVVSNTGIDDLLPHLNELDADLLSRVLATHPTGVKVLLAPRDLERAEAVAGDEIRRVLAFLAGHFDYVIVDTSPVLDAAGLAALDYADQIVLLTTPDVVALRNAGRFMQLSRRLGYPPDKVLLIVNRVNAHYAVALAEIEKRLATKPVATIVNSERAFHWAISHGEALADGTLLSSPARGIRQLAAHLSARATRDRKAAGLGGILRRFRPARREPPAATLNAASMARPDTQPT